MESVFNEVECCEKANLFKPTNTQPFLGGFLKGEFTLSSEKVNLNVIKSICTN